MNWILPLVSLFVFSLPIDSLLARESNWGGASRRSRLLPERETGGCTVHSAVKVFSNSVDVEALSEIQSEVALYLADKNLEKEVVSRVVREEDEVDGTRFFVLCMKFSHEIFASEVYRDLATYFQVLGDPRLAKRINVSTAEDCDSLEGISADLRPWLVKQERGNLWTSPTEPRNPNR